MPGETEEMRSSELKEKAGDELASSPRLFAIIVLNLIFLIVLTGVVFWLPLPEWLSELEALVCRSELGIRLGSALCVWSLMLTAWRMVNRKPDAGEDVTIAIAGFGFVMPAPNRFHPWFLSDQVFYVAAVVLIGVGLILGFSKLSPFPVTEAPPIVEYFQVQGYDSLILPGTTITLTRGSTVRIVANFPPGASPQCIWQVEQGRLTPAPQCATIYHLPALENDTIEVIARARCLALTHVSSLNVVVVDRE